VADQNRPEALREEIDRLIKAGDARSAHAALGVFWRDNPRPAGAGFVLSRFEKIRSALPLTPCRLAFLRSFTVEPVIPLLCASAAVSGIDLTVKVGDFNAYVQELLDPASGFYQFAPDVAILAVQSRDVAPDLWSDFPRLSREQISTAIQRVSGDYRGWIESCRSRSQCHIIVHTLEVPFRAANGILDWQQRDGQTSAFREINAALGQMASALRGVYLLDYDGLVAQNGRASWHDERNWVMARLPIAASHLPRLASEWLRFLHPLTGKICKALAVDLDNTLWGGVIGEDGLLGIQLGSEYPGIAFSNLQRVLLDLSQRGILLAVCSKNNPAEAMEAIEKHPAMLLRPSHFAALRINWNDKAQNLREIAAELNIGIDALAFLDDNPAEREWIRNQVPEATVIDLPPEPMDYADALREVFVFERLTISSEDRERSRYYGEQRLRDDSKRSASSLEEFYHSLKMQVEIAPVSPHTLARVAQLTQKTNQFNLTTRRYNEQQILAMSAQPSWRVYSVGVRDRFGDNGIVGVVIARAAGPAYEIDTFLLSCRVIGRTVETALLSFLASRASVEGATTLAGEFRHTQKNAPAAAFYSSHGFRCTAEHEGCSRWEFDLVNGGTIQAPRWLQVTVSSHGVTNESDHPG
jgi:FkbH-like protein